MPTEGDGTGSDGLNGERLRRSKGFTLWEPDKGFALDPASAAAGTGEEPARQAAVVGVICEYDPFHRGHRRQFEEIQRALPGAGIVCLMSGCFTQRGMPALHAPDIRARAALENGADVVLELPCAYAVRDAEHFALGGAAVLHRTRAVTHLSFGAEDAPDVLWPAARLLEAPSGDYRARLRQGLNAGMSFARAQGAALGALVPEAAQAILKPNNILALCYLRALLRLNSPMIPLPVLREGAYHAQALEAGAYPSAKAVRAAFLRGEYETVDAACGYALPREPVCLPDALDRVLLHTLRVTPPERLSRLPLCSEGLENRLSRAAKSAVTREKLLEALKTKRYAYARLSRLCCHALLDAPEALMEALPGSVRLLGFRRESAGLLGALSRGGLRVVSKAADGNRDDPVYQLDLRAYDLWALGANLPAGMMLRQKIVIL